MMKKLKTVLLLLVTAALCFSCSSDDDSTPKVPIENFTQSDLDVASSGTEHSFSFTANSNWSISVTAKDGDTDASWCSIYPMSGAAGDQTVRISTKENESYDSRSVTVTLTSDNTTKTFVITQAQKGTIALLEHEVTAYANGGSLSVKVLSSVDFEVESISAGWISLSPNTRGIAETTLSFTVQEYNGENTRSAEVALKTKEGLKDVLTVTQRGDEDFIYVETPGTLPDLIKSSTHDKIKIAGNINSTDCASLGEKKLLDLSDVLSIHNSAGNLIDYLPHNHIQTDSSLGLYGYTNVYYGDAETIIMPQFIKTIRKYTFLNCVKLRNITLPDSLTSIEYYGFMNCSSLEEILLPNNVTSIGQYAFYHCESLKSLNMPNSVTEIDFGAFSCCYNLSNISLSNNLKEISISMLSNCQNLRSITIPSGVTTIGGSAFYGCKSLTNVNIPSSVTEIGGQTFYGCDNLTEISLPENLSEIGEYMFSWCYNLGKINIPCNVQSIGEYAFQGCAALSSVSIHEGIRSIGAYSFSGCSKLNDITIPSSVTSIGEGAFYENKALKKITVPDGVTSIEKRTFYYCYDLSEATLSDNIVAIGDSAFEYCMHLPPLHLPEKLETIGDYAFAYNYHNNMSTAITIPQNVKKIGSHAFVSISSCHALPTTPPELGKNAFESYLINGLFVPKGCIDVYKNSDWGKICYTIEEEGE